MPAFGFSVGDVIATVELIKRLVDGLKASTGASAIYQRTIIELEGFARVLRQVETLVVASADEDGTRIDSLRAAAFATSLTLNAFLEKFRKYEQSLGSSYENKNKVKKAARATQFTMGMDEDVEKLQRYISGQLLSINTLLQLLERDTSRQQDIKYDNQHSEVLSSIERQTSAVDSIDRKIAPMSVSVQNNQRTMESLAKRSLKNTGILVDLHKRIIQSPSAADADSIKFIDALGRSFKLPYTYFEYKEVFEGFLKQSFASKDLPGRYQVENGNFILLQPGSENGIVTKANWASNVYPGATLTMAIIMTMLKISTDRCPRPSCGWPVQNATRNGSFLTCVSCGLTFRYDPDVELLGFATEDSKIQQAQAVDDLDRFGQRFVPLDINDAVSPNKESNEVYPLEAFELPPETTNQSQQFLSAVNLNTLQENLSKPAVELEDNTEEVKRLTSIDWNSGSSRLAAWLNASAMPMDGPSPGEEESFRAEVEQLREEKKGIESLKRIHFTATVPKTVPLQKKVRNYETMALDTQIHIRKIVDRFPLLPDFLAKRFADSNVARENKLWQAQLETLPIRTIVN